RRSAGKNRLSEAAVLVSELQHFPCCRTKFSCQVVGRFLRDWVSGSELFPEITGESFAAVKDVRPGRAFRDRNAKRLLNGVDGVFCHRAMGGPLSAHDAD